MSDLVDVISRKRPLWMLDIDKLLFSFFTYWFDIYIITLHLGIRIFGWCSILFNNTRNHAVYIT